MKKARIIIGLAALAFAGIGFGVLMAAGQSTQMLFLGIMLVFAGAVLGMFLGFSALRRSETEPTTMLRDDGPVIMTVEQKKAAQRKLLLWSLIGAIVIPFIVVPTYPNSNHPVVVVILAAIIVGAVLGPLVRLFGTWWLWW
jgi:hypothetical protein